MPLSSSVKTATVSKYIHIVDEKNPGNQSGSFSSGAWRTRDLNTIKTDETGAVTLSSNQFTLPAGTYRCRVRTPAYQVDQHKSRLFNVSDSSVVLISDSGSTPSNGENSYLNIVGQFSINSSKTFEIQHQCTTTNSTNGFGQPSSISGVNEIYTIVELEKIEEVSVVEVTCN